MTCSIIIPTYNRRDSLQRLMDSIGRATIPPEARVEVIVVDNGSTDGTATMLANADGKPHNVAVLIAAEPRKGKASALNKGLSLATGDLFLILDDDVTIDANLVARQLESYRLHSFDAVQGRLLPGVDAQGNPADMSRLREYNIPLIDYGEDFREIRGLTGTNMSFKRAVFEAVGWFDPRLGPGASGFSEDSEYSMRIRKAGFKIGYTPHAIAYHELDGARFGREYNRAVEYRKGVSRSIYRHQSILFRVIPNLVGHCFRFGFYRLLGNAEKAYKTEGRILKCCGYVAGKLRQSRFSSLHGQNRDT